MMQYDASMIRPAVQRMLSVNMGLKENERVLFVGDTPRPADWCGDCDVLGDTALRALMLHKAHAIAKETFAHNPVDLLFFETTGAHGAEPPAHVADAMQSYDVIVIITSFSLSHTTARSNACARGARIASCANLDLDMLLPGGVVDTDYYAIQEKSVYIAKLLSTAKQARIVTPHGTDLRFSLEHRKGYSDDGFYTSPGSWGNLPGGEAYTTPLEGTGEGRVVVPAGWAYALEQDMSFRFARGELQELSGGGGVGAYYQEFLFGPESPRARRNLAELGIGTNGMAKKADSVLEAEKIDGTVHIALGDNAHMGGTVETDFHDDFVLPSPDLYLDGQLVIQAGNLLV